MSWLSIDIVSLLKAPFKMCMIDLSIRYCLCNEIGGKVSLVGAVSSV